MLVGGQGEIETLLQSRHPLQILDRRGPERFRRCSARGPRPDDRRAAGPESGRDHRTRGRRRHRSRAWPDAPSWRRPWPTGRRVRTAPGCRSARSAYGGGALDAAEIPRQPGQPALGDAAIKRADGQFERLPAGRVRLLDPTGQIPLVRQQRAELEALRITGRNGVETELVELGGRAMRTQSGGPCGGRRGVSPHGGPVATGHGVEGQSAIVGLTGLAEHAERGSVEARADRGQQGVGQREPGEARAGSPSRDRPRRAARRSRTRRPIRPVGRTPRRAGRGRPAGRGRRRPPAPPGRRATAGRPGPAPRRAPSAAAGSRDWRGSRSRRTDCHRFVGGAVPRPPPRPIPAASAPTPATLSGGTGIRTTRAAEVRSPRVRARGWLLPTSSSR